MLEVESTPLRLPLGDGGRTMDSCALIVVLIYNLISENDGLLRLRASPIKIPMCNRQREDCARSLIREVVHFLQFPAYKYGRDEVCGTSRRGVEREGCARTVEFVI